MMLLTKRSVMIENEIREARPDEAGDIAALVRASITELCTADHGGDRAKIDRWLSNKTEDEIQARLKRDNVTIFVTDTGHQIVTARCHDARRRLDELHRTGAPAARAEHRHAGTSGTQHAAERHHRIPSCQHRDGGRTL